MSVYLGGLMLQRVLLSCGSLILLFLALLVLAGIFDALNPPEPPKGTGSGSEDSSTTALVQSSSRVDRQLCVVVAGQRLRARFELVMPAHEGLVKKLWRSGGASGSDLVTALLGKVSVAQFSEWPSHKLVYDELVFGSPRLVFVGGDTARILTESDTYPFGTRKVSLLVDARAKTVASGVREITVDTRDVEIESGKTNAGLTQTVTSASAVKSNTATETGCWTSLGIGMTRHVYLLNAAGRGGNGNDSSIASFVLNNDHVVSLRTADVAGDTIPAIDSLLRVSVNAFPYGLAAWYLWRTRLRRPDFRNCLLCTFWLVAATGALWTARYLLFDGDVLGWMARRVSTWVTAGTSTAKSPSVLVIDTLVLIGSLAWPLTAATLSLPAPTPSDSSWRWRARTMIPYPATMAAAVVAAAVLNQWSQTSPASAETYLAVAVLGAVIACSLTVLVKRTGAPGVVAVGSGPPRGCRSLRDRYQSLRVYHPGAGLVIPAAPDLSIGHVVSGRGWAGPAHP